MYITKIRTHNPMVAKHAPLTTTLTLYLFSTGFNTLCTALQSFQIRTQHVTHMWPLVTASASLTHTTNHHDNNETDDDNSKKRTNNGNNHTISTTSTTSTTSNPGTATNVSIMAQTTRVASFGPFGEFFFILHFFLIITKQYLQLLWERAQTTWVCHLSHQYIFFFILRIFFITKRYLQLLWLH